MSSCLKFMAKNSKDGLLLQERNSSERNKIIIFYFYFTLEVDAHCQWDKNKNGRVAPLESVSIHPFIILEKRRIKISDKTFF